MSQLDQMRAFYQAQEDASKDTNLSTDEPAYSVGPRGGFGEIGQPWGIPRESMPEGARLCVHKPASPDRVALCSDENNAHYRSERYYIIGEGEVVDRCERNCPQSPSKLAEIV